MLIRELNEVLIGVVEIDLVKSGTRSCGLYWALHQVHPLHLQKNDGVGQWHFRSETDIRRTGGGMSHVRGNDISNLMKIDLLLTEVLLVQSNVHCKRLLSHLELRVVKLWGTELADYVVAHAVGLLGDTHEVAV